MEYLECLGSLLTIVGIGLLGRYVMNYPKKVLWRNLGLIMAGCGIVIVIVYIILGALAEM